MIFVRDKKAAGACQKCRNFIVIQTTYSLMTVCGNFLNDAMLLWQWRIEGQHDPFVFNSK